MLPLFRDLLLYAEINHDVLHESTLQSFCQIPLLKHKNGFALLIMVLNKDHHEIYNVVLYNP